MTTTSAQPGQPRSAAPTATGPILTACALHKTYRLGRVDVPVLRGVDLTIAEGEFVAILGASGSGKSTLLHLLGGLDRPDRPGTTERLSANPAEPRRSSVLYRGRPLTDLSSRELDHYRRTTVGFVFQFYHLLPELTVLQNVLLAAMVRRGLGYLSSPPSETTDRGRALLDRFGLGHRLRHRPAELSGGERQRVAIARALVNDPPILLADEPTGNLDRKTGSTIMDLLVGERTGRTLVIVTHDHEVAARADRVVTLVDGRIAAAP
jgi:lipoprotein-releasing system ATP-binding protein